VDEAMQEASRATVVERARGAAVNGDWRHAYELLIEADTDTPLAPADLPFLAAVAYAAGHLDVTIEAWERAHAASLRAGDRVAAAGAAVRVGMHLLFDTALLAPVRGWLARAERLLEGEPDTPAHAWLAVVRSYERFLSGDFESACRSARLAIDVGTAHDAAAAALGRVAEARSLILQGDVTAGLELLNEAGVAAVSGEVDPLSKGVVYCELVCALQALGQYDVAEQWTEAMERWHQGQPVGSMHGRCRVHRAEILRLRGACAEAEHEALLACDELRPYLRRELGWPLTELGRIRLRMGDVGGAETAFLAADRAGWDPQPGPALVQLAHGDAPGAALSIRDALDRPSVVPSKEWPPNSQLRRAPLLEAQVEIAIAAEDVACARAAAEELGLIAALFHSSGMAATATFARGQVRLAEREPAEARREFEAAAQQWLHIGAPYETALARMGLGYALRAQGHEDRALLEFQAAGETFERIGALPGAARASAALADTRRMPEGVPPVAAGRPVGVADSRAPEDNVFRHVGDYWSLAFAGREASMRDSKGLRYLSRLLVEPGREFHVLDLVALDRAPGEAAAAAAVAGDAGELLDTRAKAAYRRRLTEIEEDLSEAAAMGDSARQAQAEAEREILVRELSRAVGLGDRSRRAGSASERARSAVTRAVRHALRRIHIHHTSLGDHLARTIRTGTYCVYSPDPRHPIAWKG
jgi:tetratricopeptide (TPR) repeat protein